MRKLQEELKQKEERILLLSNNVDQNKMADPEIAAELQSLQAGEERRSSNASQTGDCCMEALLQHIIALGANQVEAMFQRYGETKGRCQEEKKDEGIVKTNKSKTKPVSSWRCQRQAGAMKALQWVVWSLIFLGFGVHLVNAEEQRSLVQQSV